MKTIIVMLMLSVTLSAQTVSKRAGEIIYLEACGDQGDTVNFYRKTGTTASASKIGFVLKVPGVVDCKSIQYVMPTGTTKEYRFFAVPVKSGEVLEETNGVRVKRK